MCNLSQAWVCARSVQQREVADCLSYSRQGSVSGDKEQGGLGSGSGCVMSLPVYTSEQSPDLSQDRGGLSHSR